jgi:hypothetical protein
MHPEARTTSLQFRSPAALGILAEKDYLLFDIHQHVATQLKGHGLDQAFHAISIPGQNLQLFCLRQPPARSPCHLWGGKRIAEVWDAGARKLILTVHAPAGVQDTLFLAAAKQGIEQVLVNGKRAAFFFDPVQGLAHGTVTFTAEPLKLEVLCSPNDANGLPEGKVTAAPLALRLRSSGG